MAESISTIRADFDRIALLANEGWNHNDHYYDFLLRQLPAIMQHLWWRYCDQMGEACA